MGKIISSKIMGDKVLLKIKLSEKEAHNLKGGINNAYLFSLDMCKTESRIIERGNKGVTKYFSIPICHRTKAKKKPRSVSYNTIDLDDKVIFIYTVSKSDREPYL
ncbi:hypothetical protein GF336_04555 [Candidatus Woesearchaeota archaeon]|nr:hypothetical protein [Candidatus Woesearchaeota archaeon]